MLGARAPMGSASYGSPWVGGGASGPGWWGQDGTPRPEERTSLGPKNLAWSKILLRPSTSSGWFPVLRGGSDVSCLSSAHDDTHATRAKQHEASRDRRASAGATPGKAACMSQARFAEVGAPAHSEDRPPNFHGLAEDVATQERSRQNPPGWMHPCRCCRQYSSPQGSPRRWYLQGQSGNTWSTTRGPPTSPQYVQRKLAFAKTLNRTDLGITRRVFKQIPPVSSGQVTAGDISRLFLPCCHHVTTVTIRSLRQWKGVGWPAGPRGQRVGKRLFNGAN